MNSHWASEQRDRSRAGSSNARLKTHLFVMHLRNREHWLGSGNVWVKLDYQ
ncbi:hypothetical protein NFI96_001404, partial [Prochilodus magdalenae]